MPEQQFPAHLVVSFLDLDNKKQDIVRDGKKAGYRLPTHDIADYSFWIDEETIFIPHNRLIFASVITPQGDGSPAKPPR